MARALRGLLRAGPGLQQILNMLPNIQHTSNTYKLIRLTLHTCRLTLPQMRQIWGNMCWYVHKFRQGRYRSPKIATQTFGPKKSVFKKCFFRWSETFKTRDVLTTTGTFTRALPLHETLLNLEIWKHLEVEARGPFVSRPTWKFLFQKITRSQGEPMLISWRNSLSWKTWWRRVA